DVRAGVVAEYDAIEGMVDFATDWAWGLHLSSLTPDERRVLRNRGHSPSEIVALEAEGRGTQFGHDEFARTDADDLLAELDELLATRDGFVDAASSVADEWSALADEVAALDGLDAPPPAASAGGPYTVDVSADLTLDASASAPAPGADGLAEVAWDVDGDGEFDDAEGRSPAISLDRPGSHVVGVRVVDDAGGEAVSHAVVQVEAADAPTITAATPAGRLGEVTVGAPETFEVDVNAEGPVDVDWTLDGEEAGTDPAFVYDPEASDVGFHELRVAVTDAAGQSTHHAWDIAVELPDADGDGWTGTTDCDDADSAVHPGALERPGNDVDDDCDDGTPDAPPGGLVGTVRTWGSNALYGLGIGTSAGNANTPQTPDVEEAVQVETGFRSGYALLPSGEVRSWGSNFNGQIGDGSTTHRSTPQTVLGVDGASSALTGVVEISASHRSHVLARRADGTVVGWGDGRSGVLADVSNPAARPYPTVQRLDDDTPLDGVVAVKANSVSSFAITDDGRLWSWGVQYCRGGRSGQSVPVSATPSPLTDPDVFDVRQVDAHQAFTLILRGDGTVLSCGASGSRAGRPVTIDEPAFNPSPMTAFGPGSGIVDIATGDGFALALRDDGSVWAWGININDQLSAFGLAAGAAWEEPRELDLPDGPPVIDIEVGTCHSMLRRADGSALQFGCNWLGQLATGDFLVPAEIHEVLPDDAVIDSHLSPWNTIALTIPRSTEDGDWDWPVGYASASVSDVEVVEGGTGTATVTLDQELPSDVSVDWSVLAGSATEDDLPLPSGTVTIPAGSTEAIIEVAAHDDDIDEPDEHFTVALTGAANGLQLDRSQGTGTLLDDDEAPTVTLTPTEVPEGDTTLTDVVVEVALSHPSSDEIVVTFESADGSATAPDDYAVLDTTVTFAPGETSAAVHVAVRGDTVVEPDEAFEIVARDGDGTTLDTTTVTIVDDDTLSLSIDPLVTLDEGTGGTTTASVTIGVDPAPLPGESVTVDYEVIEDTATIPDDIENAAGTIVLTADAPTATLEVDVVTDDIPEDDEVFRLAFSDATASDGRSVLGTRHTTVVVHDDDDHNAAPSCETVQADPMLLWAPNHDFRTVTVGGGTDPDGDPVTLTITTVTQDEPVEGRGDGNTGPDARWRGPGDEVDLRAERDGSGDGRIYRIGVTASDGHGGTCETTVQVGVPKAKGGRHATPVESSLIVDSFTGPYGR
ncbi:MAG: Calx-beta domain-containing protein, partial [Ilumatobacteraceae bacterium]